MLPVEGYHLTGEFGDTGLWSSTHTGLDFAADEGAELRAIGPGEVVSTESDGAFGNKTVVKLDDGTVLWYCHQSEFAAEPGQRLAPVTSSATWARPETSPDRTCTSRCTVAASRSTPRRG